MTRGVVGDLEWIKSGFMDSSLGRKLAVAFAAALLSIAGLGVLQYLTSRRSSEEARWVSHTQDVLRELARARNSINRADARRSEERRVGKECH